MEWYRKAAAQNVADAEYYLGLHYEDAAGVAPDRDQATQWFHKAAERGSANAKTKIAALEAERAKPRADAPAQISAADATTSNSPLAPVMATHTLPPYPDLSQKLGEEGISVLRVGILASGSVGNCAVTYSTFDRA